MSTNASSKPNADSDDPWEELAESLFGTEYGKEHAAAKAAEPTPPPAPAPQAALPTSVEFEESAIEFEEEPASPLASLAAAEEGPAETVERPKAASPQDSYWDALAHWTWDEGDAAKGRGEPPAQPAAPAVGRSEAAAPREEAAPRRHEERRDRPSGRRGDRDDSRRRGSKPPRKPHRDREAEPTRETGFAEEAAAEPAARSRDDDFEDEFGAMAAPELDAGDDFGPESDEGAGTAERADEGGEGGEGPRRRRRRRRRRGRSRDEGATGSREGAAGREPRAGESEVIPGSDWDETDEPASESAAHTEKREPAPRASEPVAEERGRRDRRDEGRREEGGRRGERGARGERGERGEGRRERRGSRRSEEDFTAEVLSDSAGATESSSGRDQMDDDPAETFVNYDDVPTWEEAISYLLNPQQVQVDPSSQGTSSAPPRGPANKPDQPRQTRHMGGRRHRN